MRPERLLLVAVAFILAGCAGRGGPPPGPVVSPTGIVYEPGTPPVQTRYSQTALLYLRSGTYDRALEHLLEGIETDPGNPVHYFLAGSAYAQLGKYEEADRMFTDAQRIYPAYELDIEPEREAAWAEAFNEGAAAFGSGDVERAIEAWRRAALIFDLRPEAHRNLARLLYDEGLYDQAIDVYLRALAGLEKLPATRVLEEEEVRDRQQLGIRTEESLAELLLFRSRFAEAEPLFRSQLEREPESVQVRGSLAAALSGQGRHAEASEIYGELLDEQGIEATQLFNLGIALFRTSDYVRAAEAFGRLAEMRPNSRDVWFNYANSLFAAEAWDALVRAGRRLIELDPLGENAWLITARAHLEAGDELGAVERLDRIEAAPVHLEALQMRPAADETAIHGRVKGNQAEPGAPIRVRFTFYEDAAVIGTETVMLRAPRPGESTPFELSFAARAVAYRYELLP